MSIRRYQEQLLDKSCEILGELKQMSEIMRRQNELMTLLIQALAEEEGEPVDPDAPCFFGTKRGGKVA